MSIENIDTKKAPHTLGREYAVLRFKSLLLHGVVAIGVVLLPVPAVGAHFLDAVLSHPAQLVLGLGGVGIEEMCADSWNWQKNNPDGYHTVK